MKLGLISFAYIAVSKFSSLHSGPLIRPVCTWILAQYTFSFYGSRWHSYCTLSEIEHFACRVHIRELVGLCTRSCGHESYRDTLKGIWLWWMLGQKFLDDISKAVSFATEPLYTLKLSFLAQIHVECSATWIVWDSVKPFHISLAAEGNYWSAQKKNSGICTIIDKLHSWVVIQLVTLD